MAVLSKSNRSSGARNPAHGRVGGDSGGRCGPTRSSISEIPHPSQNRFRIASLNVGTLRGRTSEVVETVSRRGIDLCCLQEVRWKGVSARMLAGKDSRYKLVWVGNKDGTAGVEVLLAEKWIEKVFDIKRVSDRLMLIKIIVGETIVTVLSAYAPQVVLDAAAKDAFYDDLQRQWLRSVRLKYWFHVGTSMTILENQLLDMKVYMVVMGLVSVTLKVNVFWSLLLQMILLWVIRTL